MMTRAITDLGDSGARLPSNSPRFAERDGRSLKIHRKRWTDSCKYGNY
jgi:hypothetical protein